MRRRRLSESRRAMTRLSEILVENRGMLYWTQEILFEIDTSTSVIVRSLIESGANKIRSRST